MGASSEMKDGIDIVLFQAPLDLAQIHHIPTNEAEVGTAVEQAKVIKGSATIQYNKADR